MRNLIVSTGATLARFSAQLQLAPLRVAGLVCASFLAGAVFHYGDRVTHGFGWGLLLPLFFFIFGRFYLRVAEIRLSDRVEGTYQTLRAAGIGARGYLLASALMLTATIVCTLGFVLLGLHVAASGWQGSRGVVIGAALLIPWIIWLFYAISARVMHARNPQVAESRSKYDLAILILVVLVAPLLILTFLWQGGGPNLIESFTNTIARNLALWPLVAGASWLLLFGWLLWLGYSERK